MSRCSRWRYTVPSGSMTDDIREHLLAQPFVPFTIHVVDGKEYRISTPDHAHVLPNNLRVDVYMDDGRTFRLPARQLSGLETDAPRSPDT